MNPENFQPQIAPQSPAENPSAGTHLCASVKSAAKETDAQIFQPQMTQISTDELNALSQRVIACAFAVHSELGNGFLEKVYENALCIEFEKNGLKFERQKPLNVFYAGTLIGEFQADIVVENTLILELKAIKSLTDAHAAQCINYLKATGLPLCLLINFGEARVRVKRFINTKFSSAK